MRIQTEQLFNKTLIFLESVVCYGKLERCFIRQAYFDVLGDKLLQGKKKDGVGCKLFHDFRTRQSKS